ncbi:MAG: hypothetical protein GX447_02865, partial [Elusimicrobia bacterium]|nr:hypothetical protein [Elusimicrobiota bacterium]
MKIFSILILSFSFVAAGEFSVKKEDLKPSGWSEPSVPVEKEEISVYKSVKLYAFEKEARDAGKKTAEEFENLGVSVIGVNVFEKDGDYGFSLEYLPVLKDPEKMSSFILKKYKSPASYWNRSLAETAAKESENFFSLSPLKSLEVSVVEGENYSFSLTYYAKNLLKKSEVYYAALGKVSLGEFTFENQANQNAQILLNKLKNAGFAAFNAYPVESGENWKVEIEYFYKTDKQKTERPEYSPKTYESASVYNFEKDALSQAHNAILSLPGGVFPLAVYAAEKGGNWSFFIDYAVKNLYLKEKTLPEYEIKKYFNPETFTFESEAKKAMEEKFLSFLKNGLYPLDKEVTEKDGEYGFYIDYFSKNSQNL